MPVIATVLHLHARTETGGGVCARGLVRLAGSSLTMRVVHGLEHIRADPGGISKEQPKLEGAALT